MRIVVVIPTTQYFPAFLEFAHLGNLVVACNLSHRASPHYSSYYADYKYDTSSLTDIHTIYFCSLSVFRHLCFLFSVIHQHIFSGTQPTIELTIFFSNKCKNTDPFFPTASSLDHQMKNLSNIILRRRFWEYSFFSLSISSGTVIFMRQNRLRFEIHMEDLC